MSQRFVLVVMDNHKATIWNQGLEAHAPKIDVIAVEPLEEHDVRGGEPRGPEAVPSFLEEISKHLKQAKAILILGPGKGKSSGPLHLRHYLMKKHPDIAVKIFEIEGVDLTHTSEKEMLAHARIEKKRYITTH